MSNYTMSVFIRTYRNDAKWLGYCLKGLHKRVKFDELVIVCPNEDYDIIYPIVKEYKCKFIHVKETCEGYIAQQLDKMNAHKYCSGDLILFVDSDVIFTQSVDVNYFLRGGNKPFLLRTRYDEMPSDHAVQNWQWITEKMIDFKSEWEYMRRLPLIYWRETFIAASNAFPDLHKRALQNHAEFNPPRRAFTEFNFLGQFIEKYHYDYYELVDTKEWLPESIVKQYWSYSNLTEAEEAEIKQILE